MTDDAGKGEGETIAIEMLVMAEEEKYERVMVAVK